MENNALKHVWFINHYAQEPGHAGGTRHYSIARNLSKIGWKASVIAASVELNTGRQRLADGTTTKQEKFNGVPFLWVRTTRHKGNGPGRLWNMLVFSARLLSPVVTRGLEQPDVIVGSSVHPFAAWSAAILARRREVPFVFEVRDLWPQTLIDLGRLREHSPVARLLRRLEIWLYRRADRIVVLLPRAAEYIVPLGIPADKIVWIPNGVEMTDSQVPAAEQNSEQFTFMYFGAHGTANGLENLLLAMQELGKDASLSNICLRLIGDGPRKESLTIMSRELGLSNVEFEPPVPKADIPSIAAQADAFVFNLVDAPVFKYGISSNKLFDFMAAARPIVFCCDASNNPVAEAGAGISVEPGNANALSAAMKTLAQMPENRRISMGRAGRDFVSSNHEYGVLAKRYAEILDDVASSM